MLRAQTDAAHGRTAPEPAPDSRFRCVAGPACLRYARLGTGAIAASALHARIRPHRGTHRNGSFSYVGLRSRRRDAEVAAVLHRVLDELGLAVEVELALDVLP